MSAAVNVPFGGAETTGAMLAGEVGRAVWLRATYRPQDAAGTALDAGTGCGRGRPVLVFRDRFVGVPMRRPAVLAYPGGARGRVRLFGFDDLTLAVPLDTAADTLPDSTPDTATIGNPSPDRAGGFVWWRAVLTTFDPRTPPVPADLATALSAAGADLASVSMAGHRRHAVLWVAAAPNARIRAARVATVVDAARACSTAVTAVAVTGQAVSSCRRGGDPR
ncbi:YdeI/OmpD-associated family protein [Fodinicola feengrottensis]|uniref:YdeI/OmpD-associated family protein n=1 Tax=Fodinicola feengrottensis TaxID=435914 RepID=UPI0013D66ABA|nr:YdeI/OmpD-associated family protein [Fodinicola feengrottensis]